MKLTGEIGSFNENLLNKDCREIEKYIYNIFDVFENHKACEFLDICSKESCINLLSNKSNINISVQKVEKSSDGKSLTIVAFDNIDSILGDADSKILRNCINIGLFPNKLNNFLK